VSRTGDGLVVLQERTLDLRTSRDLVHYTLLHPDGRRTTRRHSVRLYTLTALAAIHSSLTRVNRALCELLGRSEAELLDSTIADLAEPGDDPVLANLGRAAAAEGAQASLQVERSCRRADGARLDLLISAPCCTAPSAAPRDSSAWSRTTPSATGPPASSAPARPGCGR
jgi:PAS domain S-box-containing protein